MSRRIVVIGVGNTMRRDDGAGIAVVERLRGQLPSGVDALLCAGEATSLIDAWTGAHVAVLVDATAPAGAAGTVRRIDAGEWSDPAPGWTNSSHGLGPGQAIALGRALTRLPRRLVVIGIEAGDVSDGPGLSPPVAAVVEDVARRVVAEVRDQLGGGTA